MKAYITTPIFYVNAQPHLGHAYTAIVADAYSRYRRLEGDDVRFQTGTDEHGDKIAEAAEREGVSPKKYVDKISGMFRSCWPQLSIQHDNFIRTTDPDHIRKVQAVLQKLYDHGDIVFSDYTGLYCTGCERFLTEKELKDGKCPDHLTEPDEISEKNYFFKMSKYQDWLIEHIKTNPQFITPERYRNEVLSFLSMPLEDLCISRPTSRLTWGIPLPFDENFVTYVWFDALLNYLSGIGYSVDGNCAEMFDGYWQVAEHVIAKDILKPHAIFWPTMLKAMGLEPYKKLHVHGYWNVDDTKMSKSIGNVVRPQELIGRYGVDTVRYFLLRDMSFGLDSSFSDEQIIGRQNSDLANDLGNLFSRTLAMVKKFTDGKVPVQAVDIEPIDQDLIDATTKMIAQFRLNMAEFKSHLALQAVWEVISLANKYIVANAPWELAKDPAKKSRLQDVIYNLLECLRLISLPLHAVMPTTASKMQQALGIELQPVFDDQQAAWGNILTEGADVFLNEALFPRLEKKKAKNDAQDKSKKPQKSKKKKKSDPEDKTNDGLVTFDAFQKFELRVASIIAAEKIAKSDRLLKLTVNAPEERIIVAGIAEYYQPDELVGRLVIIVANLKPAKLMGVTSYGMVLAAKDKENGRLVLSSVSGDIPAGSRVA